MNARSTVLNKAQPVDLDCHIGYGRCQGDCTQKVCIKKSPHKLSPACFPCTFVGSASYAQVLWGRVVWIPAGVCCG